MTNYPPLADRLMSRLEPELNSGCWLYSRAAPAPGYGRIYYNGGTIGAHRASWIVHFGRIPNGMHVLHKCDVPACCNPSHLFLGTRSDNMQDKERKGRGNHSTGTKQGSAKLNETIVLSLRRDRENGMSYPALGRKYGVCQRTAFKIANYMTWKNVTAQEEA